MAALPQGFTRLPSGAIRWRVSVNGQRRTGTAATIAQARRERAQVSIELGHTPGGGRLTVSELVDVWLAEVDHAASTATRRDIALAAIPAMFMDRQAIEVTPPVVASLWRQMAGAGTGAHTIDKARNALSAAFRLGVDYGLTQANPIGVAKFSPPTNRRINPPDPATVRTILNTFVDKPALAAWFRLMATIGARPGELCALRWSDFTPDRATLHVGPSIDRTGAVTDGKNGQAGWRLIEGLDLPTTAMLRRVERTVGIDWIFHRNGQPWRPEGVALEFRRACDRLGIDGVRTYDLRHFAATQALAAGVPVPDVAYMLGDNPATVLRVYSHATGTGGASAAVARALDG